MNHYWILLYLFLLLYNIHIYVESLDTGGITTDSSTPRKAEIFDLDSDDEIIVVDDKNKPVKNPIPVDTSHNNTSTSVAKQVVGDSGGGTNVTSGIELDLTERTSTAFYDYDKRGNVESYIPKPGVFFGLIKTKTGDKNNDPYKVIWRAKDNSECSIKAELCYIYDKAQILTIYMLNNNKKVIARDLSKEWSEIDPDERVQINLNLGLLYHSNLDCKIYDENRIYKVKNNFIFCGAIFSKNLEKRNINTIWETTNPYEFANKIVANGAKNVKKTNKVSVFLENGNIIHYIKSENEWVHRFHCIEVDINIKKSTYEYTYIQKYNICKYETKVNFLITKVVFGTGKLGCKSYVNIWEAKNRDEYSKIVEVIKHKYVGMYEVTIDLTNGNKRKIVKHSNMNWTEVDLNNLIPVPVEIKSIYDTCFFFNDLDGNVRTFTPKPGFIFNALIDWTGMLSNSMTIIWEAKTPSQYSDKVTIDFVEVFNSIDNVTLYLINGKIKHFLFSDKKWFEIDPAVIVDISTRCIDKGYYNYKDGYGIEHFVPFGKLLFKGVISSYYYGIKEVKVDVWTAKNKREYAKKVLLIPLSKGENYLVLFLVNNEILILYQSHKFNAWVNKPTDKNSICELRQLGVDFSDLKKPIKYDTEERLNKIVQSKPVSSDLTQTGTGRVDLFNLPMFVQKPKNLIDLDITKVYGLRGYDVLYIDNKLIFEARPGNVFKIVRKSDEIAWQPKKIGEYPNKVIYKNLNGKEKIKVYFPGESIPEEPKNIPLINFNPSEVQVEVSRVNKYSIMAI